jgi:hypothetical protein
LILAPWASLLLLAVPPSPAPADRQRAAIEGVVDTIVDAGDFKLVWEKPKTKSGRRWSAALRTSEILDESLADLNKTLALPRDIPIHVTECGQPNAFFDPEKGRILLCLELPVAFAGLLADDAEDEKNLEELVVTATDWVLHHEIGHALRDAFDLPIVGKEEDAVDELATILYIRGGNGESALVAASSFFDEGVEEVEGAGGVEDLAFWDEHSLSLQRYYSIVCLVIGSDPEEHADVAKDVPELKDRGCEAEYAQKDAAWDTLLAEYTKEDAEEEE